MLKLLAAPEKPFGCRKIVVACRHEANSELWSLCASSPAPQKTYFAFESEQFIEMAEIQEPWAIEAAKRCFEKAQKPGQVVIQAANDVCTTIIVEPPTEETKDQPIQVKITEEPTSMEIVSSDSNPVIIHAEKPVVIAPPSSPALLQETVTINLAENGESLISNPDETNPCPETSSDPPKEQIPFPNVGSEPGCIRLFGQVVEKPLQRIKVCLPDNFTEINLSEATDGQSEEQIK